ncbi:hypothetical protein ABW21_db0202874 [Orbilia brochopaga]|nr:hypothetical protein ABW21_db0202874 [Drechslerella brochopaga]
MDENQKPTPPTVRSDTGLPQTSPSQEKHSDQSSDSGGDPSCDESTSSSGLRGTPIQRQLEPLVRHHVDQGSTASVADQDDIHPEITPFSKHKAETPASLSSPLKSALKSPTNIQEQLFDPEGAEIPRKEKSRVSFSAHDQVLLCNRDENMPLTKAQKTWKVCKRTSRASSQEESERQAKEEELEQASAYPLTPSDPEPSPSNIPAVSTQGRENLADPSEPYGQRARAGGYWREFSYPHLRAAKGRSHERLRDPPQLRALGNRRHRHRHGFTECEHGFLDPMDCTCDDPDLIIEAPGICGQCATAFKKKRKDDDDNDPDQAGKDDFSSWWTKFSRKMTF